jgi:hypothetical protein
VIFCSGARGVTAVAAAGELGEKILCAKKSKPQNISKIMRVVGRDVTVKLSNINIKLVHIKQNFKQ